MHLPDVVQVDRSRAALLDDAPRPDQPGARLVTADVHLPAREVREQLLQQLVDERDRAGIGRAQGAVQAAVRVEDRRIVVLAQRPVARVDHPAGQVAEGVLVRHQLDVALAAVGVQLHHLLAGHRRPVVPHLAVVAVGESVLGVELELVDLPLGEQVDQAVQAFHGRHPVAADVEHQAAVGDVGMVGDPHARQDPVPRLARDLPERHRPVEGARLVMAGDVDALGADGEQVTLLPGATRRIDRDAGADVRFRAAVCGELPARAGLDEGVAHRGADAQQRRRIPSGQVDQPARPQPVPAPLPLKALRRRQEDRRERIGIAIRHRPTSGNSPDTRGSLYPG